MKKTFISQNMLVPAAVNNNPCLRMACYNCDKNKAKSAHKRKNKINKKIMFSLENLKVLIVDKKVKNFIRLPEQHLNRIREDDIHTRKTFIAIPPKKVIILDPRETWIPVPTLHRNDLSLLR